MQPKYRVVVLANSYWLNTKERLSLSFPRRKLPFLTRGTGLFRILGCQIFHQELPEAVALL